MKNGLTNISKQELKLPSIDEVRTRMAEIAREQMVLRKLLKALKAKELADPNEQR